jgi:predicted dehydrogenase
MQTGRGVGRMRKRTLIHRKDETEFFKSEESRVRVGIVGVGHWGIHYCRIFCDLLGPENVLVYDRSPKLCSDITEKYKGSTATLRLEDLLENVDGVVISTPPSTHHAIALQAIMHKRNILIEKPMAMSDTECREINYHAEHNHCRVLVGHTFLYNPAILKAKSILKEWKFRHIYYMEAFRRHLGLIREDVNAVWDLAAHDIAIFNYWLDSYPLTTQSIGWNFISEGRHDTASIFLNYPGGVKGAIHVSWVDAAKRRDITVIAGDAKLIFDDLRPDYLVVQGKGAICGGDVDSFGEFKSIVRTGDEHIIDVPKEEPLKNLCEHFIHCCEHNQPARTSGEDGRKVVKVLEAADRSMKRGGALVEVLNG